MHVTYGEKVWHVMGGWRVIHSEATFTWTMAMGKRMGMEKGRKSRVRE